MRTEKEINNLKKSFSFRGGNSVDFFKGAKIGISILWESQKVINEFLEVS